MSVLKKIAHFVNWAVVLVLGAAAVVWCIWGVVSPTPLIMPVADLTVRTAVIIIAAGGVLIALNIVLVWDFLSRAFGMDYLRLESSGGRVSVSVKALQDALERAVKGIAEVSAARVRVSPPARKGKPVVIKAYVSLRGTIVYHSISRAIMNVLETTFNDIVSEDVPVRCQVFWEKIRKEAAAPPAGKEPSESLRPRFPVEEEQEQKPTQ